MTRKSASVDRRRFLKSAAGAAAGAAALGAPAAASAASPLVPETARPAAPPRAGVPFMPAAAETTPPPELPPLTTDRTGSDFMVDVLKSIGFEYVFANPGSSFRGLQESLINYGNNRSPEFITCCHEESSVAMAHGYSKAAGKPAMVLAHGTVGLQHAAMAV